MNIKSHYKYVIIGAGSGGLTVAAGLKGLNKDFLIVSKTIGGECTHTGCIPSKTLLHFAEEYYSSNDKGFKNELRENIFLKIKEKISQIEHHDKKTLSHTDFVLGEAKFLDKNKVLINTNDSEYNVSFDKCIVSTGSNPITIEIRGLDKNKILTNENIFNLEKLPKSLNIIGGGYIGCEIATSFAKLGVKVTIITRSGILSGSPRLTANIIRKSLRKLGVTIVEHATVSEVFDGKLHFKDKNHIKYEAEDAEYYLMALGRKPKINNLDLVKANIDFDECGIKVDKNFRSSNKKVFAIGDCINGPKYTHLANNHGRFLVKKFIFPFSTKNFAPLPGVTYTDPRIASVGILEESGDIKKFIIDFSKSERALIEEKKDLKGIVFVNMVTGRIVGASVVGEFAEHIVNFFTLAVLEKTTVFKLENFMAPYPTLFSSISTLYTEFVREYSSSLKSNLFKRINIFRKN